MITLQGVLLCGGICCSVCVCVVSKPVKVSRTAGYINDYWLLNVSIADSPS